VTSDWSRRRRIAYDRDATPSRFAQAPIRLIVASGRRTPTSWSLPVAGRPRFLGLTFIDFCAIFRSYRNFEPKGKAEEPAQATQAVPEPKRTCLSEDGHRAVRPVVYPNGDGKRTTIGSTNHSVRSGDVTLLKRRAPTCSSRRSGCVIVQRCIVLRVGRLEEIDERTTALGTARAAGAEKIIKPRRFWPS
jgi:hypothetical protein